MNHDFNEMDIICKFEEYDVVYAPGIMSEFSHAIASAVTLASNDGSTKTLICVDDGFLAYPPNLREFFLLHEIGHFRLNHLDGLDTDSSKQLVERRRTGEILDMEIQADDFAFECLESKYGKTETVKMIGSHWGVILNTNVRMVIGADELATRLERYLIRHVNATYLKLTKLIYLHMFDPVITRLQRLVYPELRSINN